MGEIHQANIPKTTPATGTGQYSRRASIQRGLDPLARVWVFQTTFCPARFLRTNRVWNQTSKGAVRIENRLSKITPAIARFAPPKRLNKSGRANKWNTLSNFGPKSKSKVNSASTIA